MLTLVNRKRIESICDEQRGDFTSREFREMLVSAMKETGIQQIPSKETMHSIVRYLSYIAPKMSIAELRLAFELLNTIQIDIYLERPPVLNLRLISQLVMEYARLRSLIKHERRIYANPVTDKQVITSDEEWLSGLRDYIMSNNTLPLAYRWVNCVKALISENVITEDEYEDEVALMYITLEKRKSLAVSISERADINKTISDDAQIRVLSAKSMIEKLYKQSKLCKTKSL